MFSRMKNEKTPALPTEQVRLSPPWYTLQKQAVAVLTSKHVTIGKLDVTPTPYVFPVTADTQDIAVALASILPKQYTLGNVIVVPNVTFNGKPVTPVVPKTADEVIALFKNAFKDNPLLTAIFKRPFTPMGGPDVIFPIFAAQVVQFFNDDLTDYYNNFNGVLALCARLVLVPACGGFSIDPSTAKVTVATHKEHRELAEVTA